MSQETGFVDYYGIYGRDPYGGYYGSDFILFPIENEDDKIHPKIVVFGVEINSACKVYREDDLKELKTIEDSVLGYTIIAAEKTNIGQKKLDMTTQQVAD